MYLGLIVCNFIVIFRTNNHKVNKTTVLQPPISILSDERNDAKAVVPICTDELNYHRFDHTCPMG